LYVLDEPTIGLHPRDNEQLLAALHQLQSRGNSIVVVEHDEETMRRADYIIDLGPGAGVHGGEVVATGTLAELMKQPASITGHCLRTQEPKPYPARGERRAVREKPSPGPARRSGYLPLIPRGAGRKRAARPPLGPHPARPALTLRRARFNNLKNLTIEFPLA